MSENKKHGLGRGLGALLGEESAHLNLDLLSDAAERQVHLVQIEDLRPGTLQPRKDFKPEAINALADSIREKGILQPILVRKLGNSYEIIAGERRFRAAKLAGLAEVPVIEKEMADNEVLEIGLIENIVRQDLTPLEEAGGLKRLLDDYAYTQEKLSKTIGKSRSYIANSLRLLTLPNTVKQFLAEEKISAAHARTLVNLPNADEVAVMIVRDGWNVRQTEEYVNTLKQPRPGGKKNQKQDMSQNKDAELESIEAMLSQKFSTKVQINAGKNGKGKVILNYDGLAHLEKIIEMLEQ